jgi:hypothetical protein
MSTISIARRKFGQLLGAGSRQARVSSASPRSTLPRPGMLSA